MSKSYYTGYMETKNREFPFSEIDTVRIFYSNTNSPIKNDDTDLFTVDKNNRMIVWNNYDANTIETRTFYNDGLTIRSRFIASSNGNAEVVGDIRLNYKISYDENGYKTYKTYYKDGLPYRIQKWQRGQIETIDRDEEIRTSKSTGFNTFAERVLYSKEEKNKSDEEYRKFKERHLIKICKLTGFNTYAERVFYSGSNELVRNEEMNGFSIDTRKRTLIWKEGFDITEIRTFYDDGISLKARFFAIAEGGELNYKISYDENGYKTYKTFYKDGLPYIVQKWQEDKSDKKNKETK